MQEPKLKRPVRLGINPLDLSQLSPKVWVPVAKDRIALDKSLIEIVDKNRSDEIVAVFTCPILEAAFALDQLLSEGRAMNQALGKTDSYRAYVHRGLAWVKLRASAIMTIYDEETNSYSLNPEVFPIEEEPIKPSDLIAPPPKFSLFKRN